MNEIPVRFELKCIIIYSLTILLPTEMFFLINFASLKTMWKDLSCLQPQKKMLKDSSHFSLVCFSFFLFRCFDKTI